MTVDEPAPAPLSDGRLGWGILGPGGIARVFTRDLLRHGHRVAAVGSRSVARARAFADEHGVPQAHGSYDALVADPSVDIVYVATPHHLHADNAVAALESGKHVLVEKAFTLNAAQASRVADLGRERGLVVVEAMWTRFLPHMRYLRSVLASGRIGRVLSLQADHTQRLPTDPAHRLNDLGQAGGCLLDLGVYPISFAHDVLGDPVEVLAFGTLRDTGVDTSVSTMMCHADGALSTTYSTMLGRGRNVATILGTEGRVDVESVWYGPAPVVVRDAAGAEVERYEQAVSGRGMQYQAAEVERLAAAGELESPLLTPAQSVSVMETLDAVRAAIGVRYPGE